MHGSSIRTNTTLQLLLDLRRRSIRYRCYCKSPFLGCWDIHGNSYREGQQLASADFNLATINHSYKSTSTSDRKLRLQPLLASNRTADHLLRLRHWRSITLLLQLEFRRRFDWDRKLRLPHLPNYR